MEIKILTANKTIKAKLNNTETAKIIYNTLPLTSKVNKWGDEIYFSIPIKIKEEKPTNNLEIGDIAYWQPGNAFCIFFGRTPASTNNKPKAASSVTIFGKITSNIEMLKTISQGEKIKVEKC